MNVRVWIKALGYTDALIRAEKKDEAIRELIKYKANVIQSDEPEEIRSYLKSKGLPQ